MECLPSAHRASEPLLAVVAVAGVAFAAAYAAGWPFPELSQDGIRLQLALLWTAAGVMAFREYRKERSTAARIQASIAPEPRSTADEIRYALDQAAIVALTDDRGIIRYVNDQFCSISKYSKEELIGQDHRIINSGYHPKEFMRELWHTIASGQVWRGEIRNRAKDGSFYWVDTTIVPFLKADGKPRQYLAIRSDVTARKRAEAQIREQSALTHLGQLAAVVAHEVRNPLAGLRASLQVLARRPPVPGDPDVLRAMIQRIDDLNAKVEDLLLYARPKPAHLQAVNVRSIAAEIAVSARVATGNTGPAVPVFGGEDIRVRADPDMLRAALLNVTMNACQAAGPADVEIRICGDDGLCRVAVCDRGPGIPPDVSERAFEPFFTTRAGGTGLGLAIVKRLMELQEGAITLGARPGGGTIAQVTIPRVPSETREGTRPNSTAAALTA